MSVGPSLGRGLVDVEAARVHGLPAPDVGAHVVDAVRGPPAELAERLAGVGRELGDIAGAPRRDLVRDGAPGGLLHRVDHLQHAVPAAHPQVVREAPLLVEFPGWRQHTEHTEWHRCDNSNKQTRMECDGKEQT